VPDRWAEEASALAGMGAASVQGRLLVGPRAGATVRRLGDVLDAPHGVRIRPNVVCSCFAGFSHETARPSIASSSL